MAMCITDGRCHYAKDTEDMVALSSKAVLAKKKRRRHAGHPTAEQIAELFIGWSWAGEFVQKSL